MLSVRLLDGFLVRCLVVAMLHHRPSGQANPDLIGGIPDHFEALGRVAPDRHVAIGP